ncbi:Solute carrier family 12 member 3 [Armadillidium nasatum]|uniref:Solute carrier family 12 member 3 n=1 Tax=Armadillidium nasatum TaxID=96803 RepID=A0A5N5TNS9_9CRUS|nr:Solute carrier family 12 member 3 [Armadillidium nasatum]
MCKYGLQNSFQVMELVSAWGPLIYMGCFAATLSSAIASLVGAPRVLQALGKDRLYPVIHVFEVGYGANNDPVRGYILVFVISFACIMIGQLNAVSSLLTNCFLASYALINFSCFHASLIKSPGWRPSFKYYNLYVSLIGGLMCLIVMFLIDYVTALVTFVAALILYMYVAYRKPDVNWGSSTQAQTYVSALKSTLELIAVEDHIKNYRPQVLLFSGSPGSRPPLVDFANSITKNLSFLSCANIVKGPLTQRTRNIITRRAYNWLGKHKIKAFYCSLVEANDLEEGAKFLFQLVGLGKLRPNMILMGYKSNWRQCDKEELKSYFNTLHEALNMYLGLAILRVPNGLDYSHMLEEENQTLPNGTEVPSPTPGTIDVWWLYDDGGLTLLLPYILTTRSQWAGCKLRVFALANRKDELDMEQRSMANLLSKFRIDFSDMIIIPDLAKKAGESSRLEFEELIRDFKSKSNEEIEKEDDGFLISDAELLGQKEKTNRHIRLRELLLENSKDSSLIVMTLPMPRKNSVSAALYMAWIETLTKDMPPFMLIRGNQTSVLTFYS